MKKSALLLLVLSYVSCLFAQPIPCADPPMMTSTCADACIICDIDGFTGRNDQMVGGEAPPGFCTTTVHNGQWIAFIAGSTELKIRLDVSNCRRGWGLEVAIYEGINCDNFRQVSNCDGDVGTSQEFLATDLTIGQYYYLVMDGNGGDNCDWTFTVLEGDTRVDPLEESGLIIGNETSCPGVEQEYILEHPIGATEFLWELDNRTLPINAPSISYTFDNPGFYLLCATAYNACNAAPRNCKRIEVMPIPPTDLGDVKICEGDNFEIADTILNATGFYEFHIPTSNGCDSVVIVDLEAVSPSVTDFGRVNICEGDQLPIGDKTFDQTGIYTEVLTNRLGCDSTVTLDLFVVICNLEASIESTPTTCYNEATGSIDFQVNRGTPPFTYNWVSLNGLYSGSGDIPNVLNEIEENNLAIGSYFVTINDNFQDSIILIGSIEEPLPLTANLKISDYNGFQISCVGEDDGSIELVSSGGTRPYTYLWETGSNQAGQRAITSGTYGYTITDVNGCVLIDSTTLLASPPLIVDVQFQDPNCTAIASGEIMIQEPQGGIPPYSFRLDNAAYSDNSLFSELIEGNYQIQVKDGNNCIASKEVSLDAPIIPVLELPQDTTIELADFFKIIPRQLTGVATAQWRTDLGLSDYEQTEVIATPLNRTTYQLVVTSEDNCTAVDSILINVLKVRDVYVPNVFSPNQDGLNDRIYVHAGPEANNIQSFSLFNRWGDQVFEQTNIPPNDADYGWDGLHNGQALDPGVFIWMAKIEFVDGEVIVYSGDVAILR